MTTTFFTIKISKSLNVHLKNKLKPIQFSYLYDIIKYMNAQLLTTAAKLLKDAGCTEVFLFGSQATGNATANSDVDLGVKGLPPTLFFRIHSDLEEALRMPVDLVDFDYQKDFYEMLNRIGELKKIG